jgi:predicted RNase H-like nuclease
MGCSTEAPGGAGDPVLLGVDGCRAGWLAVGGGGAGTAVTAQLHRHAAGLLASPGWRWIAIDIPIGLPERGRRGCDAAARQRLGARRSSVFPAPLRAVLDAPSHAEACARSRRIDGRGLPLQSFHLLAKIRELDELLRGRPELPERVVETHPEVCFQHWNGGRPMRHPKRSAAGRQERLTLVETLFPGAYAEIRSGFRRGEVADDDILDALALLRTAGRLQRGEVELLGDPGARDACGLPMRIAV